MVLEKTLEIPLDCKEIQPVHSEGDPAWDFFGRNDAKVETSVLLPEEFHGERTWQATVQRISKSQTQLCDFHFHFHFIFVGLNENKSESCSVVFDSL